MRSVARPAVIFGGPSPEHDISILTGLQAARALADAGRDPLADLLVEDRRLPPRAGHARGHGLRQRGARRRPQRLELVARPGGGFVGEGSGRFGKRGAARDQRRRQLLPRRPGRGRHASRPRSTWPASATPARRPAGAALGHGQAGLRRGDGGRRPPDPAPGRAVARRRPRPRLPGPVHREAPLRRLVDRHRDHRRPRRRPGARADVAPLPRRRGRRAVPARRRST